MTLKPYITHDGDPTEGALLVFAHSAKAAKPLGFEVITGWDPDCRYIDVRVRRLRKHADYLRTLADQDKLAADQPHAIDDLPSCITCLCWGTPLNEHERCDACQLEIDAEQAHG